MDEEAGNQQKKIKQLKFCLNRMRLKKLMLFLIF